MNSLIDTSFCSTINSSYEAATNIVNYLTHLGDPSMDTINAVYKGVGLGTSTTENFSSSTFYDFWKINDNPQILGNIISQVSVPKTSPSNSYNTRYDLCKLTRSYNQTVLQGFFCNEIENTGTYPILGEEINENSLQFNNIHSYLRSEPDLGGTGLEACTDPSGANNNLNPVLEDFCLSSFSDSISSSEQSLYISSNQDIYKWCGCYVNPTGFSVSMGQNSKICNPLCTYQETIKSFSRPDAGATNLVTDSCIQTICAIDQVSIKSVDNEGNINFSQICPGCKEGGNCTCVIDSSVQGILDKIRTGQEGTQSLASFKQVCPNANCYISEATGGYTPITCNTNNPSNTNKDPVLGYSGNGFLRNISEEEKFTTANYAVLIVFCLIFILYSLFSLLAIEGVSIYEFISSRYATKHRPSVPKGSYGNAKDHVFYPEKELKTIQETSL